jgi:hypothetical protein
VGLARQEVLGTELSMALLIALLAPWPLLRESLRRG